VAALCSAVTLAGTAAYAGGTSGAGAAAADHAAGKHRDEALGDALERRPGGLKAGDPHPADRAPSFSEEDERVDRQVEDSDAGTTATESGASERGNVPKPGEPEGSGVVAPKEP